MLSARIREVGPDLLLVVEGGQAHIGAVSMAEPGPYGTIRTSTVSGRGHRESELTIPIASEIAETLRRRVVVLGGIHLDGITEQEIADIKINGSKLAGLVCGTIRSRDIY